MDVGGDGSRRATRTVLENFKEVRGAINTTRSSVFDQLKLAHGVVAYIIAYLEGKTAPRGASSRFLLGRNCQRQTDHVYTALRITTCLVIRKYANPHLESRLLDSSDA